MGSVSLKIGDGTARFKRTTIFSSLLNILMLLSVIATNLFALYAFTSKSNSVSLRPGGGGVNSNSNFSFVSDQLNLILNEISSSQKKLARMEKDLLGYESIDLSRPNLAAELALFLRPHPAAELALFLRPHPLPLGKDSRSGITEMVSSVGHFCEKSLDLLSQFMTYKVSGPCPDDWSLGQKLILRGCEPLPRRRCFSKVIPKVGFQPLPSSLWKPVSDKAVSWSGLGCKSFECVNTKKVTRECNACLDLGSGSAENQRFVKAKSKHDFLIDDVLALGGGGIRIVFDIASGSGTFAARMAERGVTVITNTLNVDAPLSEFIAARGLFPLYLSLDHRFPFHNNVFDLVHSLSRLDVVGKAERLEFLMFDLDRILRAGGLFWLDNFYCANDEKKILTWLIERFGYKKLKWVVGEKLDVSGKSEVYLSAVLQKPARV